MTNNYLWLEVSNVRTEGSKGEIQVQVQLKGDRTDKELTWWDVKGDAYGKDATETTREIFRALDSKRIVLAGMGAQETVTQKTGKDRGLTCYQIRIQFSDSGSR
ncbi:MAG TPA: hypothetical protein VLQ45_00365 [Thermoanaerobaculia bacterium]|nr:hypothetical protein [Thermoanaerobaculia bacterium]